MEELSRAAAPSTATAPATARAPRAVTTGPGAVPTLAFPPQPPPRPRPSSSSGARPRLPSPQRRARSPPPSLSSPSASSPSARAFRSPATPSSTRSMPSGEFWSPLGASSSSHLCPQLVLYRFAPSLSLPQARLLRPRRRISAPVLRDVRLRGPRGRPRGSWMGRRCRQRREFGM